MLDILHDQDELLRNFYARETRLSAAIQNVRQLLELETAARPFPLCGPAELVGKRVGYMPDGWILEELRFGFKPLRALRALIFRGRLPDALGNLAEASELMLEVEGQVSRFTTTGLEVEWVVRFSSRRIARSTSRSRVAARGAPASTDTPIPGSWPYCSRRSSVLSRIPLELVRGRPGENVVFEFTADNLGRRLFYCHNLFYLAAGMAREVLCRV